MRGKRNLTYTIKELPKDPLDVTFGNDSGCCIFVPKTIDKLGNGVFVPYYLADPNIRLFALYRVEKNKEQRMGLVVAFETVMKKEGNRRILSCNSLELSSFGIAGGNATIGKINDYVEKWLIGYAQQHGFDGVTMGSQPYNSATKYSKKIENKVKETLIFPCSFPFSFYSDIFMWSKKAKEMRTRNNSCYWLWRLHPEEA